jgi:hypothetical protein
VNVTDDDLKEAIKRIGLTLDGELLYLWLQKRQLTVDYTTEPGALQQANGQRILAAELMVFLSAGINETYAGARSDHITVFKLAEPTSPAGERDWSAKWRAKRGILREPEPGADGVPGPGDAA